MEQFAQVEKTALRDLNVTNWIFADVQKLRRTGEIVEG